MYKLKFVSVDSVRNEQDMIEEVEQFYEIECDYFVVELLPGFEHVKLKVWFLQDISPQVVESYTHVEEFEFEDLVTGDKFGLNPFNDLFWKLRM